MDDPILKLRNYTKPFEVHTDVSDYAIGGVLVQQGNPVAYKSRKLNEIEGQCLFVLLWCVLSLWKGVFV